MYSDIALKRSSAPRSLNQTDVIFLAGITGFCPLIDVFCNKIEGFLLFPA